MNASPDKLHPITFRGGYTTGACAAAAAKAAALMLVHETAISHVSIMMPDRNTVMIPVVSCEKTDHGACAGVRKDGGDDPDVTTGCIITASITPMPNGDVIFRAGDGVGTVTLAGLSVPPGEPAINPVPRAMIRAAVREVTSEPLEITIAVSGGRKIAEKTYNPRLGITGGISILGTTGYVRPFSVPALRESLRCALDVAIANGIDAPVLVPGNIGRNAAKSLLLCTPLQIIEVSNEWGYMLDAVALLPVKALCIAGHPGKLAKLAAGDWDTHSSRSGNALDIIAKITGSTIATTTAEGFFAALPLSERLPAANTIAAAVGRAVALRCGERFPVAVVLNAMNGAFLGSSGDCSPWQR